ncbi:hypothetical protein DAI22_02g326500 [Oryza sativa Japonica Group]|uniref:Uncharacterized protein n=1 Tax=Oryza sativa subsp. japonica TaxID=39947 RepID=Q6Z733_ORYSJ|nr:hypothetical protein DAI22_02g326500 [Oryza sativa Japonica Group]BAD15912.1 hypothetical protein [Oryza sativa Japonica Group]
MAVAKRFVLPLMMVVLLLSAVSGSARPMGGDKWVGMATSGDHPLIQFLQNLYLQQLSQPGPSCRSNDQNNKPPPDCHN